MLSTDEIRAFETACRNRYNYAVQELFNALGVTNASAVLMQAATAPGPLSAHILRHVREAIHEQQRPG
ncbi:MAG TPA: hypothetical protein VMS98_18295 [Thermoanaerobaculia bacterium]|nr:hypothetical protein [Thermoanaerobaculia bacterium]